VPGGAARRLVPPAGDRGPKMGSTRSGPRRSLRLRVNGGRVRRADAGYSDRGCAPSGSAGGARVRKTQTDGLAIMSWRATHGAVIKWVPPPGDGVEAMAEQAAGEARYHSPARAQV